MMVQLRVGYFKRQKIKIDIKKEKQKIKKKKLAIFIKQFVCI